MSELDYGTDNGAPCTKCGGTVWRYGAKVLKAVWVSADCIGCGARYPAAFETHRPAVLTAAFLSEQHRRQWPVTVRAAGEPEPGVPIPPLPAT